ncbi:hypothetical protein HDU93_005662, partial [Gonapodya sp. JEL0774]
MLVRECWKRCKCGAVSTVVEVARAQPSEHNVEVILEPPSRPASPPLLYKPEQENQNLTVPDWDYEIALMERKRAPALFWPGIPNANPGSTTGCPAESQTVMLASRTGSESSVAPSSGGLVCGRIDIFDQVLVAKWNQELAEAAAIDLPDDDDDDEVALGCEIEPPGLGWETPKATKKFLKNRLKPEIERRKKQKKYVQQKEKNARKGGNGVKGS